MTSSKSDPRSALSNILERYAWEKVQSPKTWRPTEENEELCGFYGGKTIRSGAYGQYEVVIVHVPMRGTVMVSGTQIVQLIDASGICVGWPVRVRWLGLIDLGNGKAMKSFDVFVAEGDPLEESELPQVKGQRPPPPSPLGDA